MMSTMQDKNYKDLTPKETLLAQLDWVEKSYLLGFTASFLLRSEEVKNIMRGTTLGLTNDENIIIKNIDLNNLDKTSKSALQSFLMFQIKVNASQPFELIKDYCKNTCTCKATCKETCPNMARFKKLEFYHFGRILRNCLSHNGNLEFNKSDEKILPASWGKKTITIDMDRKPLRKSVFKYNDVLVLIDAYRTFVEAELK